VRNLEKGKAAKEDIESTTKCAKDVISVWEIDMASYASVQKFAARVDAELDRVDIFIANAGVASGKFIMVEDNERMITINVISTFLLAGLVMPKLKATAAKYNVRPVLTITSSEVHSWTKFTERSAPDGEIFATLADQTAAGKKPALDYYPISKLLEVFGVRAIAAQHPSSSYPVTINCVNPGLCHSELSRESNSWMFWLTRQLLARSTEKGSRTLYQAATTGPDSHGCYMSDCAIGSPAEWVTTDEGKEVQDRVWSELLKKLDAINPGVSRNF